MNKQNSTILSIKNIRHLKHTLKKIQHIVPLSQYPNNYFNTTTQEIRFVSLDKIKEFSSVITSSISLIVGLNTSIQKMTTIHSRYSLPQIFTDSIEKTIPQESFQAIRLLDIISTNPQYILLRLALSMLKAKILLVKHNTQSWVDFKEYIEHEIYSFQSIPLSLRFNLDIHTKHIITFRDIQSYIYKDQQYHNISQHLIAFKQQAYPLNLHELYKASLKKKLSLPFLSTVEHGYFLESLISLLHPNIV